MPGYHPFLCRLLEISEVSHHQVQNRSNNVSRSNFIQMTLLLTNSHCRAAAWALVGSVWPALILRSSVIEAVVFHYMELGGRVCMEQARLLVPLASHHIHVTSPPHLLPHDPLHLASTLSPGSLAWWVDPNLPYRCVSPPACMWLGRGWL